MKIESVVIGVDFSEAAERAARWTSEHFAPGARLVLVHALEDLPVPEFLRPELPELDPVADRRREEAEQRLERLRDALGRERTSTVVVNGRPSEVLIEAAKANGADLLVAGEREHAPRIWDLLGSTAERLLHTTPIPMLLARRTPPAAPRTLLVPIEEAPATPRVLHCARYLSEQFGAGVELLHVIDNRLVGRVRIISANGASREFEERLRATAEAWLEQVAQEAGLDPERTRRTATFGDARWEILSAADRLAAELIVMGSRGSGRASQMLLGSVARSVARGAGCPVFVVTQRAGRSA